MSFIQESVPVETLKTMLQTYWESFKETRTPSVVIVNDSEGEFMRADYNIGDYIFLSEEGSESIKYRGNIQYIDFSHPITIQIGTKEGRQRLRDLWKMIRSILLSRKHNFTNWQLIRILSYTEMVNQDQNVWRGVIRIQLEKAGVTADAL